MKKTIGKLKWKLAQHLELRWWKKYLKNKDKATYYAWKKTYWNHFLQQSKSVAPPADGMKVLDAGCGPAGLFTVLGKQKVVAVDPLLEAYIRHIPHFDPDDYPHVSFKAIALESLEDSSEFDRIYCINVLNHVKTPEIVVHKLSCALEQGGILVLSVDAHRFSLLKKIFQWLPGDALHPHQHDLRQYLNWLENENLTVLETKRLKREAIFDYWLIVAIK